MLAPAVRPGGAVLVVDERAGRDVHRARGRRRAVLRRRQRDLVPAAGSGRPRPGTGRHPDPPGRSCATWRAGPDTRRADRADFDHPFLAVLPPRRHDRRGHRVRGPRRGRHRHIVRTRPAVRQVLDGAGARVVLASRRQRARRRAGQGGCAMRCRWPATCGSPPTARAWSSGRLTRYGRIDMLVNNAGVAYSGPAEYETPEQLQNLIDTNLTGLFALTQLVGRHMLDRAAGSSSTSPHPRPPSAWTGTAWPGTPPRRPGSSR